MYHATSRSLNARIEYLAKSLQRHKNLVKSQASLEEYRQSQEFRTEIKSDLARLEKSETDRQQVRVQQLEEYRQFQEFRTEMKSDLARLERSETDRQQVRVQQWLAAINSATRHENAARERFRDTGKWLLQKQRFQSWSSPEQCIDPLLWLHGIPGAGKYMMSVLVVSLTAERENRPCVADRR